MTPELQRRLDNSLPPFDGSCIHNGGELTLAQLRELLNAVIAEFPSKYPKIESFPDWHEHDGFIVESKSVSWDLLRSATQTDRKLFDSRDDDFEVRVAISPTSHDWLLRYNIDQEDESDYNTATCDFDLSVAKNCESLNIASLLLSNFPSLLVEQESQSWFESNYGG